MAWCGWRVKTTEFYNQRLKLMECGSELSVIVPAKTFFLLMNAHKDNSVSGQEYIKANTCTYLHKVTTQGGIISARHQLEPCHYLYSGKLTFGLAAIDPMPV